MSAANRTIVLQKAAGGGRTEEWPADAALKPGHLVMVNSTSEALKYATAGGDGPIMIAMEDSYQGKTIDDAYATGDVVFVYVAQKGDKLNGRLAAAATAVVVGSALKHDGAGGLMLQGGTGTIIGFAEEAVDNSGGASEAMLAWRVK